MCAVRILRKVPDLVDQFAPKAKSLLGEKNHAVLLTGIALVSEICTINPYILREFRSVIICSDLFRFCFIIYILLFSLLFEEKMFIILFTLLIFFVIPCFFFTGCSFTFRFFHSIHIVISFELQCSYYSFELDGSAIDSPFEVIDGRGKLA